MILVLTEQSFSGHNDFFFTEISGGFPRQRYDVPNVGKTPLLTYKKKILMLKASKIFRPRHNLYIIQKSA